jgi:Peptidase A4 family
MDSFELGTTGLAVPRRSRVPRMELNPTLLQHRGRSTMVAVTLDIGALAVVGATVPAAGATPLRQHHHRPGGALVPSSTGAVLPLHGGTVDSLNWSGYAVNTSTGGITAVTSTFVVPAAGAVPPGFAATWTGIGGYSTSDLIQAGIAEDSLPNNPLVGNQYSAWYELLPASETPLTNCTGNSACPVRPGDRVTVTISQVGAGRWSIAESDSGEGCTWSKTVSYASSDRQPNGSSRRRHWVTQTLANVETVHFGPTSTFTAGGTSHTIAAGDPTQIVLSPGIVNEATLSALATDGQSFNDCVYSQSCAAP